MAAETILGRLDWSDVARRVQLQQRRRERDTPTVSMYRWWARRSHALVGSLIDAGSDGATITVADPFSGGGTVAIEAARRNHRIYAQDLHPWAAYGLATTLDDVSPRALSAAAVELLKGLQPLRASLYGTTCPEHGTAEITHFFWVRAVSCPGCNSRVFLYPYPLVSLASRSKDEQRSFFGCRSCGAVTEVAAKDEPGACGTCSAALASADESLLRGRRATCDSCDTEFGVFSGRGRHAWRMVLVRRSCNADGRRVEHLSLPTRKERALGRGPRPAHIPDAIGAQIAPGIETGFLRRAGFRRWSDLYPNRQLAVLLEAARLARAGTNSAVVNRLLLAICGTSEMAGFASRWDRYYPKAFEVTANHRYSSVGFACEVNLLTEHGRGTLPRRVAASVRAAKWLNVGARRRRAHEPLTSSSRRRKVVSARLVVAGSSDRQLCPTGSVDLVVTDPPYFDDVQYAELASLYLAWARATGLVPDAVGLDLRSEAVPNSVAGRSTADYEQILTAVFAETARTLAPNGRLILTFHNSDVRAWEALAKALAASNLTIKALATTPSENATDHAKRGRQSFSKDLVIECVRGPVRGQPMIVSDSRDHEDKELLAAGMAMAAFPTGGLASLRLAFIEGASSRETRFIRDGWGFSSVGGTVGP